MSNVKKLPLLPLRGVVVFPYMLINLDIGRERSKAAIEQAMMEEHEVMLIAQKNAEIEKPAQADLYSVGTVAEVRQMIKLPDGTARILVEGKHRATITNYQENENYTAVEVEEHIDEIDKSMPMEALNRAVVHEFEEWVKLSHKVPAEMLISVAITDDAGRLADLIASHLNLNIENKEQLLSAIDVKARLEKLYEILARELEILQLENKIGHQVRKQMEKIQKDYYLREKLKAIKKELGEQDGKQAEIDAVNKRLKDGKYPETVKAVIEKELKKLDNVNNNNPENAVICGYIDTLLDLPWCIESEDRLDIDEAKRVLDHDHYGLTKVKDRILDYLAVHQLATDRSAPIICLVGPPGVGKTSLAASVARAMGRKFVRASLGGVRDEAEIRGHRRTYVGALPGRIIEGIKNVGTKNPVFLLDEVDKLASDYRGDPTAALLEVLDPAQNVTFSDHFIDISFDLSKVFWIVTANDLGTIPRPLRDRMEIIELSSYTIFEKQEIAKQYLIARQREQNGLKVKDIQINSSVIPAIIEGYTKESGVRELERVIGKLCRKAARQIVEGADVPIKVTKKNLVDFLGRAKFAETKANKKPEVGIVTGMAWTSVGGTILPVEVNILKGKGKLILTGQLGDVMQESAQAGLSYIRSISTKLKLTDDFYEKCDIHIHLPEGAIPKDGPSAGITMATAIISALTNRKAKCDVAMTGEITLRGNVLPIGGLKEKVLAAYREGFKTIILPKQNEPDIEDIPSSVREKLEFVPVSSMSEVLKTALM